MSKYAKGISALVAAILGVGVSVLVPGIDPAWAASLTGMLTVVGTVFGPANSDGAKPSASAGPSYLDN
jgi:hypothetical protein